MVRYFGNVEDFSKNVVGQLGNWLSPDGRFKKFVSSNSDLSLTWNYENGSLSFRGKVGDCLKELFISMYSTKEGKVASRTSYELVSPRQYVACWPCRILVD